MKDLFNILLAEDSALTRKIVERTLVKAGYKVKCVENGRQALELFRKTPFPIVITDWMMPEMDGVELIRAIRSLPIPGYVFIVLLTARDTKTDIVEGLKAGADDYLSKPFNPAELLARLNAGKRILELEKSLLASKQYIESVVSSMADSLIVIQSDLTIQHANNATCDLLGYTESELKGMSMKKIISNKETAENLLILDSSALGSIHFPEEEYIAKNGDRIPVSLMGSAMTVSVGLDDDPKGFIWLAHDMREVNELKEQVFQAEKMSSIGVIAAGVAHEIKNPLAIILQGIEFLKTSCTSDVSESTISDVVDRIKNATSRADKIVKDLLGFSKQIEMSFEKTDVREVIEDTLFLVENQFRLKSIRIHRNYTAVPTHVRANASQLKQVFLNLFLNAGESMPEGGEITLDLEEWVDSGGRKFIRAMTSDTGSGVDEQVVNKVFEPFFSTKLRDGNSGLGLSVSKGIIEKHQGTIGIQNREEGGTRVTISLPVE